MWSLTDNIFWSGDTWPFPVVFSHPRNTIWRPHKISQKMITKVFFLTTKVDQIRLFSDVLKNQVAPIHIKSRWIYLVLWSIWLLWAWLMEALGHIWLLPGLAEDCHGPIVHCHRSKYVITDSQVNLRNCRRCWWKSVNLPNTMFKIKTKWILWPSLLTIQLRSRVEQLVAKADISKQEIQEILAFLSGVY